MDTIPILPYMILGGIVLLAYVVVGLLSSHGSRASERLDEQKGMGAILNNAAQSLQPQPERKQEKLKARLTKVGYVSPGSLEVYLGIQAGMMFFGALVGGIYGFVTFGLTQRTLFALLAAGGIGFYIPDIVLKLLHNRIRSSELRPPGNDRRPVSPRREGT